MRCPDCDNKLRSYQEYCPKCGGTILKNKGTNRKLVPVFKLDFLH